VVGDSHLGYLYNYDNNPAIHNVVWPFDVETDVRDEELTTVLLRTGRYRWRVSERPPT